MIKIKEYTAAWTVQLEYFDHSVGQNESNLQDYSMGQWVIWVNDNNPVATLTTRVGQYIDIIVYCDIKVL